MRQLLIIAGLLAPVSAFADPTSAPRPSKPRSATVDERAKLEIQPAGRPIKQISIDNPLGDVRVEGYDGTSLQIETHKVAPDDDGLDRLRISLVPNPDGTVRIQTTADGGREIATRLARSSVRIDLVVRAPRAARVEAISSGGTIDVSNMDGGSDLDSSSGKISVRNVAGTITTHSVSGATSLVQVFGSIDARTLSSDLDLDSVTGDRLVASAGHGRIAGRRVRSRDIELTTIDGKIVLEAEASLHGRIVIASMNGDLDVRLRRHGVMVVRARGARFDFDQGGQPITQHTLPDGWVEAQFGELGGNTPSTLVEMRSLHGLITFGIVQ